MTFRMIVQLWNTNTSAFVSCDADLTENYMYISMKFGTGVHVFCWEVGVFNRSSFQSVSYKDTQPTSWLSCCVVFMKFLLLNMCEQFSNYYYWIYYTIIIEEAWWEWTCNESAFVGILLYFWNTINKRQMQLFDTYRYVEVNIRKDLWLSNTYYKLSVPE